MLSGYPILTVSSETPTLQNSFTTAFSTPITVVRKGDFCYVSGLITRSSQPTSGTVICNVSTLFRPQRQIYLWGQDGSGGVNARYDVFPSGDITYVLGSLPNTSQTIGLSGVYPLF